MATHITIGEADAWLTTTKLSLQSLELELEKQISGQIIARLSSTFPNYVTWVDGATTPELVRSCIAMYYAAAYYDKVYSDNTDDTTSNYAAILRGLADASIQGLIDGNILIPEDPANAGTGTPVFFPTDASSSGLGFEFDKADTPASFSMGQVF